jgi:hypothetical protein
MLDLIDEWAGVCHKTLSSHTSYDYVHFEISATQHPKKLGLCFAGFT